MEDEKRWSIEVSEGKFLYRSSEYTKSNSIINYAFTFEDANLVIDDFYATYGLIKLGDNRDQCIDAFVDRMRKFTGDEKYNWRRYFVVLVGMLS